MGRDKRLLSIGEETMVGHAFKALREAFGPPWVLVAGGHDVADLSSILGPSARFVIDQVPGAGPLSAVADVLGEADRPVVFLLATDMPRVTPDFLRDFDLLRRGLTPEPDALVPRAEGFAQVTCAFYRRSLGPALRAAARAGSTCLAEWLRHAKIDARYLGADELQALGGDGVFANLNTPSDHDRYLRGQPYEK